jgi:hypothetical protein
VIPVTSQIPVARKSIAPTIWSRICPSEPTGDFRFVCEPVRGGYGTLVLIKPLGTLGPSHFVGESLLEGGGEIKLQTLGLGE